LQRVWIILTKPLAALSKRLMANDLPSMVLVFLNKISRKR